MMENWMKKRLLDFLACPQCYGDLGLDRFLEQQGEIIEGKLECTGCLRKYPVIGGVPRLLPDHLMGRVYSHYHRFFQWHAGSFDTPIKPSHAASSAEETYVEETQLVYSFQHQNWAKLRDQQHMVPRWKELFFNRVAVAPSFFSGKVGLEAGSGEGRYLLVASEHCAEIVGLDLSEGVDTAFARNRERPNVHVVQGDIHHPPFHQEVFDFVYSTGVLMILPVPKRGFEALLPFLKGGAQIVVWVYNLSEANLLYRLSHLTMIHKVVKNLPHPLQVGLSYIIATGLQLFAFLPASLAAKIPSLRRRLPPQLREVSSLPFHWKVKEAHDRISLPVIHFISRDELEHWFKDNQLTVEIISKTRGLAGIGRKIGSAAP